MEQDTSVKHTALAVPEERASPATSVTQGVAGRQVCMLTTACWQS